MCHKQMFQCTTPGHTTEYNGHAHN